MIEQGVDIKTVSQMLGHTDAGFTMNTYMHVTADMQQNAVDAMSEVLTEHGKAKDSKIIKIGA